MIPTLQSCHPAVAFCYFLLLFALTVLLQNPLFTLLSLLAAGLLWGKLSGWHALLKSLPASAAVFLLIGLTNPLFVHEGLTVLFYLNGSPITLEALLRGFSAAAMLLAAFWWFACFSVILTPDKLTLLFGGIVPSFALLLSMTLRFVPRIRRQYSLIRDAQAPIGRDGRSGPLLLRITQHLRMVSILITWALENGVDTADSMQARGYSLLHKSRWQTQRFTLRDGAFLLLLAAAAAALLLTAAPFAFYPRLSPLTGNAAALSGFLLLSMLPLILEGLEALKWRSLLSQM